MPIGFDGQEYRFLKGHSSLCSAKLGHLRIKPGGDSTARGQVFCFIINVRGKNKDCWEG